MRLPASLSRHNPHAHKNQFGHVLVLAGSQRMLGAGALAGLAALRCGAGLVTLGVPKSLNTAAQKKTANEIMTWPLPETRAQSLSFSAFKVIQARSGKYHTIALGPGLSQNPATQNFICRIIETSLVPLVIDADALNALGGHLDILRRTKTLKILTPHTGEMARLIQKDTPWIERNRKNAAASFATCYGCILLLKGHNTIVAAPDNKIYINKSGNAGMAKAGSGDVLTGMIAALAAQGLSGFEAAKWGAYLHGKAGDLAARSKTKIAMTASDIIDYIPTALRGTIGK